MDTRMQNHKDIYYTAWVRAELFLDFYHKAWNGEKIPEISWPGIETIHAYFSHDLQTVDAGTSISESFLYAVWQNLQNQRKNRIKIKYWNI